MLKNTTCCPWPGPVPYRISDAPIFFGREAECRALVGRLKEHHLTVLISRSGAGKTSLLSAGLIPRLLKARGEAEDKGPAFLIREWGGIGKTSPSRLVFDGIGRSLEFLRSDPSQQCWHHRCETLDRIYDNYRPENDDPAVDVVGCLLEMCSQVGPIVLIVDQFEELLGSGLEDEVSVVENATVDLFSEIYLRAPDVRVLIGMRTDYVAHLQGGLGNVVDRFHLRQVSLDPLTRMKATEGVWRAAEHCGVVERCGGEESAKTIEAIVAIDEIASWVASGSANDAVPWDRLDLIKFQALLKEIYDYAISEGCEQSEIGPAMLADFRKLPDFAAVTDTRELASAALERHIGRSFGSSSHSLPGSPGAFLVRRVAVQMAQWLTTARGYKRRMAEAELLLQMLRPELESLMVHRPTDEEEKQLLDWIARVRGNREPQARMPGLPPELLPVFLNDSGGSPRKRDERLSGDAVLWSMDELGGCDTETVVELLVLAGGAALDALRVGDRNVLKISRFADGKIGEVELVHDALGPALARFARNEQKSSRYYLASLVALHGMSLWRECKNPELGGIVTGHKWLGCDLFEVIIKDVTFKNCVLKGTIFRRCHFIDCRFEDCDLQGTVFVGGKWENVRWKDCHAESALIKDVEWHGGMWDGCYLDGATISDVRATAAVTITDSSLRFAQIEPAPASEGVEVKISECELHRSLIIKGVAWTPDDSCLGKQAKIRVAQKHPRSAVDKTTGDNV
jgi:hypothetical protein